MRLNKGYISECVLGLMSFGHRMFYKLKELFRLPLLKYTMYGHWSYYDLLWKSLVDRHLFYASPVLKSTFAINHWFHHAALSPDFLNINACLIICILKNCFYNVLKLALQELDFTTVSLFPLLLLVQRWLARAVWLFAVQKYELVYKSKCISVKYMKFSRTLY